MTSMIDHGSLLAVTSDDAIGADRRVNCELLLIGNTLSPSLS